jgi:flagellar motor switch protein FliN/FliY
MTTEEALVKLGRQTAESIMSVLEVICPGAARHTDPAIAPDAVTALADQPLPGLAASVAYVDGVTGGTVRLMGLDGAHRLASVMMGGSAEDADSDAPLTEIEHSAVGEAMNQMIAAAAAAAGTVLGYEVEIAPPEIFPTGTVALAERFEGTAHAITTAFDVCGRPCRLVQLVPQTFVVRMRGALDELGTIRPEDAATDEVARDALLGRMRSTRVRLSAEVGRTHLPIERLVDVPAGTVIELDREVQDPIDIYVNGHPFAVGRLVVNDAAEWAVRIERLLDDDTTTTVR